MEAYAHALQITVPIFLVLFFAEAAVARWQGKSVVRGLDSVSSISSGITNVLHDLLGLSITILSYAWLRERLALTQIPDGWPTYLIAFVALDFQGYWVHRWCHEINFLWNRHIIHHSSEEFNLSCALRQSISVFFNYFAFLLVPAALLGVPTQVISVIAPIHLFLQYWYHTQLIGRMGFWEKFLVTPSHHRVHHAINAEYMDKNYGQIFILWDKWFGTFQEELPEVPAVYGVKRPVQTWNPIKINFQHLALLAQDAWRARSVWDKLRVWFMPTGWRPADVAAAHPVASVADVFSLKKYDTGGSRAFVAWSYGQMFFNYFLLVYLFAAIAKIGSPGIFAYGAFIFVSVYAYTELMDRNPRALAYEVGKSLLALWWIWRSGGDWFGARENFGAWYVWTVGAWQLGAMLAVGYFTVFERPLKRVGLENG